MTIARLIFPPLALFVALVGGCGAGSGPEQRIRALAQEAAAAVEAKELAAFMEAISMDYSDQHGNDRAALKSVVFRQFMRPGPISVLVRELEVEVEGERALVGSRVALLREGAEAHAFRISAVLRLEGGRWRAVSASWERMGPAGLL